MPDAQSLTPGFKYAGTIYLTNKLVFCTSLSFLQAHASKFHPSPKGLYSQCFQKTCPKNGGAKCQRRYKEEQIPLVTLRPLGMMIS